MKKAKTIGELIESEFIKDLYKWRDCYVGKKITMVVWLSLIKLLKKHDKMTVPAWMKK